jgi:hypothetical protein
MRQTPEEAIEAAIDSAEKVINDVRIILEHPNGLSRGGSPQLNVRFGLIKVPVGNLVDGARHGKEGLRLEDIE